MNNNNPDYRLWAAKVIRAASGCYTTFPNCPEKIQAMCEVWATLFTEERLQGYQIKRGLYWMRRDAGNTIPTPGRFLEWTRIATPDEARHDSSVVPKPLVNKQNRLECPKDRAAAKQSIMDILTGLTVND